MYIDVPIGGRPTPQILTDADLILTCLNSGVGPSLTHLQRARSPPDGRDVLPLNPALDVQVFTLLLFLVGMPIAVFAPWCSCCNPSAELRDAGGEDNDAGRSQ